ncbi:acyl-CoA dehydrogenase family protein [Pseudomonas sp. 148P]|uniref:Acyl-CoA dehydrogenase family protein n=1 Tax=Pseudomonas ulcerans TaxID=3115852 RepID=A0ABU7HNU9_9PSED|nr:MULTISPECIES: acyl-CoA dehydrogenase family protein [unclassified Pseudomonas]MEE1926186.1 acyl-CoA dehydrogenase family protein [Pseudomonas sp. 147P]MEE1933204.1 acyl-CoA dehydrogenase family protein [Pseudomonas sp. 148P]
MNLRYSEEQRLLADSARDFLAARGPVAAQRKLRDEGAEHGFDPQLWQDAVNLGWSAIAFPEELGGLAFGCMGLGPVFEAIGQNLSATPLLSSVVLGGSLLHLAGDAGQQARWLPGLIAGGLRVALALDERARHNPLATCLRAVAEGDGYRLEGDKFWVVDGVGADVFVVAARTSGSAGEARGISLFLLPADTPGLSVSALPLIDSRNCARLQLREVRLGRDALLGEEGQGWAVLDRVLDRGRACLAAELLGIAEQLFQSTLEYLKTRVQFDVPIGSFQALQHRAARLFVDLSLARSAVMAGLSALDDAALEPAQRGRLVSLAKWKAGDTAIKVANEAVQMHGGIGVTDELDVGLYLKRVRVAQACLGDRDFHCERYQTLA